MNAAYDIQVPAIESVDTTTCNLYLDIGPAHVLYAIFHLENKEFIALQYFNLDKYNAFNQCKEIIYHSTWLARQYHKVNISYNFAGSLLVPAPLYNEQISTASLSLVYGDLSKGAVFSYHLPEWEMYNIYRVPANLHELLADHFKQPHFFHTYTLFLKGKKKRDFSHEGDEINLAFYSNNLVFALLRNGKLQLLKTFEYETAEDVTYHLLNVCRQFAVDCEKAIINVSGFIDDHSSVYAGLEKYFIHIKLDERPAGFTYNAVFDEYPRHFFTALFNIALCE